VCVCVCVCVCARVCVCVFAGGCACVPRFGWQLRGKPISLELWDTSGQDRSVSSLGPYCRSADAIVLVFDVQDLNDLSAVQKRFASLIPETRLQSSPPLVFLLGNKVDKLLSRPAIGSSGGDDDDIVEEEEEEKDQGGVSGRTVKVEKKDGVESDKAGEGEGGEEDDEDESKQPSRAPRSKQEVENLLRELVANIQSLLGQHLEVPMTSQQVAAEGLVSCYLVSALSGHNCREVVEQLQLRLAYRQLYISGVGRDEQDNGRKKGNRTVRLHSVSGGRRGQGGKPPCCS